MTCDGHVPNIPNIGEGDHVDFVCCLNCGQMQGEFPVPHQLVVDAIRKEKGITSADESDDEDKEDENKESENEHEIDVESEEEVIPPKIKSIETYCNYCDCRFNCSQKYYNENKHCCFDCNKK
jgi:hypothetical protein